MDGALLGAEVGRGGGALDGRGGGGEGLRALLGGSDAEAGRDEAAAMLESSGDEGAVEPDTIGGGLEGGVKALGLDALMPV